MLEELNFDNPISCDMQFMQYMIDNNLIDIVSMREAYKMSKDREKEEILRNHREKYYFNEKSGFWFFNMPDPTKKEKRKKVKRKNKEDIEQIVYEFYKAEQETEQQQKELSLDCMTLEDLFYEFMDYKKTCVKSITIKRMLADWNKFYTPYEQLTKKPFRAITKIDIDKFFNHVTTEYSMTSKSFCNMCGILKQTFDYAVDAEYLDRSPYRVKINKKNLVKTTKKESKREVFQSDEKQRLCDEMERRFNNNPKNTSPLAVELSFELGTRIGELLALTENDITEFTDGNKTFPVIHVCKQLIEDYDVSDLGHIKGKGHKVVEYTKSESGDRFIPLTDKAVSLIQRIKEANARNNETFENYLFVMNGHITLPDTLEDLMKSACDSIGTEKKSMHKIRKTVASTLFNGGNSVSVVKDILGHADEATTMKYYIFNTDNTVNTYNKVLETLA